MADAHASLPSAATISSKLRDVVVAIYQSGNTDDLTVKRVRARAEAELGLDAGFFKTDARWKEKSKDEIAQCVDQYCHDDPTPQPTPKKAAPKSAPRPKPVEKKSRASKDGARGVKRKAAAPAKKTAKRKKASSDDESEAELSETPAEISDADSTPPKKPVRRAKKVIEDDSDDVDQAPKPASKSRPAVNDDESDAGSTAPAKPTEPQGNVSDSDLSSVIDEAPVKKQRKKSDSKPAKPKPQPKSKPKPKPKPDDDPDQTEIKQLQAWLVKCGIRKVWSRDPELSQCATSRDKISVLKTMLRDVGMDGKYSAEKAAKIKEQREFAKDLEAIKEGELAWGKAEVTSTGRPSRRAAAKPVVVQKVVLEDDSEEDEDGEMRGGELGEGSSDGDEDDDVKSDSEDDGDDKEDQDGSADEDSD